MNTRQAGHLPNPSRARRRFGPSSEASLGNGHPLLFTFREAVLFEPFPDGGGYPIGFMELAHRAMGVTDPGQVLHVCSGSVRVGMTVDIRMQCRPRIVGDARKLPIRGESFRWVMIDPPYNKSYADNLYGTGKQFPKPGQLLSEAARVLVPGGVVGLLHFLVPIVPPSLRLLRVIGVTVGAGHSIRAFTVLEKPAQLELDFIGAP